MQPMTTSLRPILFVLLAVGVEAGQTTLASAMTLASAVKHLQSSNQTAFRTLSLLQAGSRFLGSKEEGAARQIANWAAPQGADQAKAVLTKIIQDTMNKLDEEQNRCSDYDISQQGIIKVTKDKISSFNAQAALARSEILAAQQSINQAEQDLPTLGAELKKHEDACAEDIRIITQQLNLALGDVSVMGTILKHTTCTSSLIQYPTFLQCVHLATGESFATFREKAVRVQVAQLHQTSVRQAVLKSLRQTSLLQSPDMVTTTTSPAPVASKSKGQAKCALSNSQNCAVLRDRFLQIAGDLQEKVDELKTVLNHKQTTCDATSTNFETEIANLNSQLSAAQTALAASTTKQNEADAASRLLNKQLKTQESEHVKEIKKCNANIGAFQGDLCALRKIRTQVDLLKSGAIDPKFQVVDCAVSAWKTEQCSVSCGGGGIQMVTRTVMTPAKNGGALCPPTNRTQVCGDDPCPVDCVQSEWTEWSSCSAACGGGVRTRARSTEVDVQHGGQPCGEKEETETCGTDSCDADCVLSMWTDWSPCSKMCNSGSSERRRHVEVLAKGDGQCDKASDSGRFNVRSCNTQACVPASDTLQCNNSKMDVVIVLDASGSLRQAGWDATVIWAKKMVKAFEPADARIALMTFSGGSSYSVSKACAMNPAEFDLELDCGIIWLEHFLNASTDQDKLQSAIDNAKWTRSFTLMSLALGSAEAELAQGRKDANSIVIVITDGRPMNKEKSFLAASSLRKKARLVFVPVTRYAPLAEIKTWCSKPVRENIIEVPSWAALQQPATTSSVIANVCPNVI